MTAPLPERIAAAIDNYRARCRTLDEADCYGSMDRASYDEQRKGVLDARDALNAAIAEVVAEREQYRAVVARQVDDKRRLFAEGNEARSVLALVAGNLAAWVGKREEAPESAQEHLDEAMHAIVRFQPQGGYGDAASKLRLEMWHGEVYAERDAAQAEVARLASSLAAVERQRDELVDAVRRAFELVGKHDGTAFFTAFLKACDLAECNRGA